MRTFPLRCSPSRADFGHHELGRGRLPKTELRAVTVADADVFYEPQNL
jgi:hypothetical protein